jgi:hypothetical protein
MIKKDVLLCGNDQYSLSPRLFFLCDPLNTDFTAAETTLLKCVLLINMKEAVGWSSLDVGQKR